MNANKLKVGVEEAKTARPCCYCLNIVHFEQGLHERQTFYFVKLVQWKNNKNPNASNMF